MVLEESGTYFPQLLLPRLLPRPLQHAEDERAERQVRQHERYEERHTTRTARNVHGDGDDGGER